MTFPQLLQNVLSDTLDVSLGAFRAELALCATIVALLLVRMAASRWRSGAFYVMLAGTGAAMYLLIPDAWLAQEQIPRTSAIFTGLMVSDTFSVYLRGLLLIFLLLFIIFTRISGIPREEDATEFYVLVLGAVLGMCLMVAANHMLIAFLGMEMASVPSYVLAGLLRHRRLSTEAALKFAVFGAGTAGVMLYGISLLVGVLGSAHLPTMASHLADMLRQGAGPDRAMVLALGGLMIAVGLAFKLSAVPFHFWAPDVFEGATAEVAAMLSIASKTAALGLLVRLALAFSAVPGADAAALEPARQFIVGLGALLAAVTCTFGNLAAYGQTNIKRLLAYSTIAHAGYMMMPVVAAVAIAGSDPAGARSAVASLAVYVAIYLFMNLGAFAAAAFLRNSLGSERIDDYAGLIYRSPGLAVCFSIILFSLIGLPPLAGFAAKFNIFSVLARFDARLLTLLVIGGLNTVLSLFYYLRVVRVMILLPEPQDRPAPVIPLLSVPGAYCAAVTLPVILLGIWWAGLADWARIATATLLP